MYTLDTDETLVKLLVKIYGMKGGTYASGAAPQFNGAPGYAPGTQGHALVRN
jgi:hypothetical protein